MACVTAAAIAAMTAEAFRSPGERMPIGPLGLIGLLGAAAAAILLWDRHAASFGVVVADNFSLFVTGTLIVVGVLSLAISGPIVERDGLPAGEYYALMLFALAGMILMAMASDLLVIFLALEVLSLAVYVLTGIRRDVPTATEAAFKYFLLGAFSSAFFLYGIAFAYGVAGSTRLDRIGSVMAAQAMSPTPLQLLAMALLLVGFAFKVSAVPFHMWTPDAYEGAPSPVTGFMSTGVKAAAFAAFARVFLSALEPLRGQWSGPLEAIAIATMVVGTVVGVAQSNVKRMLAYSSIAHAGYLLVALIAANDVGKGAILFYLLTYAVTNLGAFGVIGLVERADGTGRQDQRLRRALERSARARRVDDDLSSIPRRISAARWLHRKMVRVHSRDESRILLACDRRRAHQRHLRLLLPAYRGDDVHDVSAVDARHPSRASGGGTGTRRLGHHRVLSRHSPDAGSQLGRGVDRHNLLKTSPRSSR